MLLCSWVSASLGVGWGYSRGGGDDEEPIGELGIGCIGELLRVVVRSNHWDWSLRCRVSSENETSAEYVQQSMTQIEGLHVTQWGR